MIEALADLI